LIGHYQHFIAWQMWVFRLQQWGRVGFVPDVADRPNAPGHAPVREALEDLSTYFQEISGMHPKGVIYDQAIIVIDGTH
jgi:hypothetical protein